MAKFEVKFEMVTYKQKSYTVEADTEDEAEKVANELLCEDQSAWEESEESDIEHFSTELIEE